MRLFQHENRQKTHDSRRLYAIYEVIYTIVDFLAAACFLVGSILFFWARFETPAVWLFVVGSAFFALKPTIRVIREVHLLKIGDTAGLARRYRR